MKYDPKAPPFFETLRGGGPITHWMEKYEKVAMAREIERQKQLAHLAALKEKRLANAHRDRSYKAAMKDEIVLEAESMLGLTNEEGE